MVFWHKSGNLLDIPYTLHAKNRLCACSLHTKSGPVILTMTREDVSYLYHLEIDSEAKNNSGHRVSLLLDGNPLLACKQHALSPLFACYTQMRAHTHTHTFAADTLFNALFLFVEYYSRKW